MFEIIVGTNRPHSLSMEVARIIQPFYKKLFEHVHIINLREIPLKEVDGGQYGDNQPEELQKYIHRVNESEGLLIICPEYNGSMPGALKYFIDHWRYPESFLFRPVAFIGLGGIFGGLRPVEHLQQIFGYRNAFIYPERVFLFNVWDIIKNGEITHKKSVALIESQAQGFFSYIQALKSHNLSAGTRTVFTS